MKFDDYQKEAKKTAIYPANKGLEYTALGLAGEAGEYANKAKKVIRDDQGIMSPEKRLELAFELGGVLWYIAEAASFLGYDLSEIAEMNVRQLQDRQKRGVLKGSGDNR